MEGFAKIRFEGGSGTATGSNFLFDTADGLYAIDCGLLQGEKYALEQNNKPFSYDVSQVKALIITHAHMDHIGRVPFFVKSGFKGKIYSTSATKELAEIMYGDALNIIIHEASNTKIPPLYSKDDVTAALSMWETMPYHSAKVLSSNLSFELKDSGHILGSAIVEFSVKDGTRTRKVVFTGDLGNSPSLLLCDTEVIDDAEYMVMESVYGNRNHESHEERDQKLERTLAQTLKYGGTAVIPAFSIERTQVILYSINNLIESGKIPEVPVFLDSPLAIKATAIYKENEDMFNDTARAQIAKGDDIFNFRTLTIVGNPQQSAEIHNKKGPKIIIAGSGMSVGGRVISHEKYYLGDPNSLILFVGYQAAGSLGRRIQDGEKNIDIQGQKIHINARIESIDGFSSHKDSEHLVEFVSHSSKTLKKVFVAMGEPASETFLAQRIRDYLGIDAVVPDNGDVISLE